MVRGRRFGLGTKGNAVRLLVRLAAAGLILALTLPPQGTRGMEGLDFWCVVCGTGGASGFLLNVALFVPLGLAAARPGGGSSGVLVALAAGLLLSGSVEAVQLAVPGRHTALGDLLANGLGAGLGGVLSVTAGSWLRPGEEAPRGLAAAWGAGAAFLLLGTAWALAPALPESEYWAQEAPDLAHLERFPGEVYGACAGDLPLSAGRLSREGRDELIGILRRGPRLSAEVRLGPPTPGLAPVVSVYDGEQREVVLLGQDGGDLVFRLRRRANGLGLRSPALRAAGLLAGREAGRRLDVEVRPSDSGRGEGGGAEPRGAGLCLRAGEESRCGVGHRAGRGWRLLLAADVGDGLGRWLDGAWIALLFLPLGYWAGPRWEWRLGVAAAGCALVAAPAAGPLLPAGAAEAAGMAAGLGAGLLLGRLPPPTRPPRAGPRGP